MFFTEFEPLLHKVCTEPGRLLVVGDLNFHFEDLKDLDARHFVELLDSLGLQQHMQEPTHKKGHILDPIISQRSDDLVISTRVSELSFSDHFLVTCDLCIEIPVEPEKSSFTT